MAGVNNSVLEQRQTVSVVPLWFLSGSLLLCNFSSEDTAHFSFFGGGNWFSLL